MGVTNGWTGGQYSLVRGLLGLFFASQFAAAAGAAGFSPEGAAASIAVPIGLLLGIGWYDRIAALLIWGLGTWLQARAWLPMGSVFPAAGLLLVGHALLPPAPFGSWAAKGRPDPSGGWRMPSLFSAAAWMVMSAGCLWLGWSRLRGGQADIQPQAGVVFAVVGWGSLALELAFGPLALVSRLRPWLWAGILPLHIALIGLAGASDLLLGLLLLQWFTFDPGWITPIRTASSERVFYDGGCGLCHATVRLVLAEDRGGTAFRFAPLDSGSFRAAVEPARREGLPDSLVVLEEGGGLLTRASAVLHILGRLGGLWRIVAPLARAVPRPLLDGLYRGIAGIRRSLFSPPAGACPIVPARLLDRFDL